MRDTKNMMKMNHQEWYHGMNCTRPEEFFLFLGFFTGARFPARNASGQILPHRGHSSEAK